MTPKLFTVLMYIHVVSNLIITVSLITQSDSMDPKDRVIMRLTCTFGSSAKPVAEDHDHLVQSDTISLTRSEPYKLTETLTLSVLNG